MGLQPYCTLVSGYLLVRRLPRPSVVETEAERIDLIVTYGLGVADILWSVPLLIVGCFWVDNGSEIGWLAARMANVLY